MSLPSVSTITNLIYSPVIKHEMTGEKTREKCTRRIHVGTEREKNPEVMNNTYFTLDEAMKTSFVI